MTQATKDHLTSALYTFLTAFALVVLPQVGNLSMDELKTGALSGIIFAALRAGIKAVGELIASWNTPVQQ